ncbi:hydroxyacid dehydrogenase [Sulfuritalea sp.]|uniref:hydroxyacid dehydrogenase n=1 Tax=Sulfuritalea sp. TaxID=2480090 RepID=UPI00286E4A2F|nr:hydroxyacid dehydrogenase [Sulfuritalea sp.]
MKIVITEFMDIDAVRTLQDRFAVSHEPTLFDRRAELLALLADATALIVRNRTQVDGELLAAAPRLRVVGRLGVGLDNIDVTACRARGIEVFPATGANALAVAEYVVASVMVLLRGAYLSGAAVAAGQWPRQALSEGRETAGRTLGLVGFGGIGQLTARLAQAIGMRVLACDPLLAADAPAWAASGVAHRELEPLLAESDAVSLHVPLTAQTRGLIDANRIGLMKTQAVLINTARGGIVDEAALAQALHSGKLAGAALDVFDHEPLAAGSPLATAPNLILTPHIGGVTRESNIRVSTLIAAKVADFLLTT